MEHYFLMKFQSLLVYRCCSDLESRCYSIASNAEIIIFISSSISISIPVSTFFIIQRITHPPLSLLCQVLGSSWLAENGSSSRSEYSVSSPQVAERGLASFRISSSSFIFLSSFSALVTFGFCFFVVVIVNRLGEICSDFLVGLVSNGEEE